MSILSTVRAKTLKEYDWLCDSNFANWLIEHITPYGNSILDVGCGNGFMIPYYMNYFNKIAVIEPTEKLCEKLFADFQSSNIMIQQACAEHIPFVDDSYDIVLAKSSLHHFSDLQKGLEEIKRVSSKAVVVIEVVTPDEKCVPFIKRLLINKEKDRSPDTVYTQESLQGIIKKQMDKCDVFSLLYDQYLDVSKWLIYSDLRKNEQDILYHMIQSADEETKEIMQIHTRGGRLVMLRRMCMCLAIRK